MRPTTTLLKSGLGELFHATDLIRNPGRGRPVPDLPTAPVFTVATIGAWFNPDRTRWLLRTLETLHRQSGAMSIAIVTNDPAPTIESLGSLGRDIAAFDDPTRAAEHLLANPGTLATLRWTPARRRTHPKEMSWGHKPLMRSVMWEHSGFANGLSHLVHLEDDLALSDGALDYWVRARPVLERYGLLPGFTRWEGRDGDWRIVDQQRPVHLSRIPLVEAPLGADDDADVLWANLPNPHQALFVLDERLAQTNLATSRYLSPARSLSGPKSWARDLGVIERSAVGPMCDDVPEHFVTRNVVPIDLRHDTPQLMPVCLVEHQPALAFFNDNVRFGRVPLHEAIVDDRDAAAETTPPAR